MSREPGIRRRLILVFLAISTMITLAFVVPLGFLVRRTAEDRALDRARAEATLVVPALDADVTRTELEAILAATSAGQEGRMTIATSAGWVIGSVPASSNRLDAALNQGLSATGSLPDGGAEVVMAVAAGPELVSAVRVEVTEAELRRGQWRSWLTLAAVGLVLVAIAVGVADRLAHTVVGPVERLAAGARRLGRGDLATRVEPTGPPELVELAGAFNELGDRISHMLAAERELVAELSHRLRTPLTALRLRAEMVAEPELANDLRADIESVSAAVTGIINEARAPTERPEPADLGKVVAERVAFWEVLANDQQRPWSFEPAGQLLPVSVNRDDLGAAVDVLIENAFAHTGEGTSLSAGCGLEGEDAVFWVADGGEGLDPDLIDRGFSASGSTGLGLDIARRTAAEVGGELGFGPSPLGGALVQLRFPVQP